MNRFINPYNPVMNFIGKLLDCIILNLLWFLCTAKKLDLVIMDAETADVFCRQGYIDRAVSLENTTFFRDAGLNQPVYAGILQNTPHKDSSEAFLKLLLQ